MATRLYYSAGKWNESITVAPYYKWGNTISWGNPAKLDRQQGNDHYKWYYTTDIGLTESSAQGIVQFVSDPVEYQIISGIIKGQSYTCGQIASAGAASLSCCAMVVRVFSGDGITERGILLEYLPQTPVSPFLDSWYADIFENRHLPPPMQLNPVVCQDGDIIVIEVGVIVFNDTGSSIAEVAAWNSGSVDLPEDETTRTMIAGFGEAYTAVGGVNPWIEFSQDIHFYGGPRVIMGTTGQTSLATRTAPTDICALIMGTDGAVVKPGVDQLTGHGIVDITFISGDPPYASVLSDFPLELAASFATVAVTGTAGSSVTVTGSGSILLGGKGIITFKSATIVNITGSGYLRLEGYGIIRSVVSPALTVIIGAGELKIGGEGVIAARTPVIVLPPVLNVVGSGGLLAGGVGVTEFTVPPVLSVVGAGGIRLGEFRVPELTVVQLITPADQVLEAIAGSGGLEISGDGIITFTTASIFAVPLPHAAESPALIMGGTGVVAFIHPQIMEIIGVGELLIGGAVEPPEIFDTYSLFGTRGEPSIYSGWNFNSYAAHRNQYFGAGPDGIYLLAGEDDDGEKINSGIRIGPISLGTERKKRLRLVRCGGVTDETQVKVSDGNGNAGYYDVIENIAACSRDIEARKLTIEISGFFTLEQLELVPLILSKR